MGNKLVRVLKGVLPNCDLKPASRAALFWLADAAPDNAPVAWLSQPSLAALIGCGSTYVGKALEQVEAAGLVSIWKRPGRVPLSLVLPRHRDGLDPVTPMALREHLRGWRDANASDIAAALEWIDGAGLMLPVDATLALSRRVAGTGGPPLHSVEGHPRTQSKTTLALSRNEPKENPNMKPKAGPRPRRPEGPAGATACDDALPAALRGKAHGPIREGRARPKLGREAWRGPAGEVMARVIAAGGPEAERLSVMADSEAVAAVERLQRLMRLSPTPGAPAESAAAITTVEEMPAGACGEASTTTPDAPTLPC